MISRIARKELLDTVRDGRFRALAVVVLAISLTSLAAGWKHHRDVLRQHEEASRSTRAQWVNQPAKNPHSAAHYGVYAFKPRTPLSLVDSGIDPYVGVAAWLEAHKQNEFKYRPAQDRTAVQRFGELTAAEGFLILLPLFIVLVTFNAFSGEREDGTLRQLLSLGVRPSALAAGKALGLAGALSLVVVPATAAGIAALALSAEGGGLAANASRALLLGLFYLCYFATLIAIGLGVSARARSSRAALVVLLAFWFGNSLIAARAASDLAGWIHPTPSAVQFQMAMEKELADPTELQQKIDRRRQELLRQHGVSTTDALPLNFSGISMQEGEEYANHVFDRHYGGLFASYERQNRIQQLTGVAAPLLPVRSLSMGLAGTDFPHHREFVNAAEDYRRQIQRIMNGDIAENSRPGMVYTAGRELWERVPEFQYEPPGAGWVLRQHLPSLLLMGAWLVAAIWFAARGARRVAVQ